VVAYSFNIAESADAFVVELVGSSFYYAGNSDWACDEAWSCRPNKFQSSFAESGKAWQRFLAEVCGAVGSFLHQRGPEFPGLANAQAVAVGFVDGELTLLKGGTDA
jgi:hypothetical protein